MSRARAVIQPHVQLPLTVLGVPPGIGGLALMPVSLLGGGLIVGGFFVPWLSSIVLPCLGALAASAIAFAVWLKRRDHHVDSSLLAPLPFWRGRAFRTLAGGFDRGRFGWRRTGAVKGGSLLHLKPAGRKALPQFGPVGLTGRQDGAEPYGALRSTGKE